RGAGGGAPAPAAAPAVIPLPTSVRLTTGPGFVVDRGTRIVLDADALAAVDGVAAQLAELLAGAVGQPPRRLAHGEAPPARSIHLRLDAALDSLGEEGYALAVAPDAVTIAASGAPGLFYGVQTLRQLLPAAVEHRAALGRVLRVPAGRVVDRPRFAWRGAMLDVSRHFLPAADVKRFVDLLALYKLNRLHLHLSDDQGWRVEIRSWPELARRGGSTQVGGGPGGYYTQAELADLAAYAAARHVAIVPEIDMPGHTNAALASYPGLNCDGVAPPLYTGTRVGFSTLCVERDSVYAFVDDVVREIGALVPTPYFHVGGDEVERLPHDQYLRFVERVQAIVRARGKRMVGWGEIAPAALHPETIVQHWRPDSSARHAARGGRVILSPAKRVYLDMKPDSAAALGLRWAGLVDVRDAYDWDPATYLAGVPEAAVLGVEAPLWSETLVRRTDFEYMAFPRLAAVAEVAWSPGAARRWEPFRARLAAHGPRLAALGVNFYRSPQVPWRR
ncbi:MAG: GH20, partial [uncultured Gemmatimonadaceae bacterium]